LVSITAEAVEKVQRAVSNNFDIVKDQQFTGHRKSQNGRTYGFSTGSLCLWNFQELENYRYSNHSCNNLGRFGSVDHGTISAIFLLPPMADFDTLASSFSYP
jgi:hypothetical protein